MSTICCISAFIVGQYQNCLARLYALSAPVWYWCNWFRSGFLSVFGIIKEELLCTIMSPHSVSWMDIFSHMGEYSFAGFCAGICFGFLYVLSVCIKFLYSGSLFAVCMSFAVERSKDSCPEALIPLNFACFGCGFTCIGVYLSMYGGGVVSDLEGRRLRASANVFLSAGICFTFILYGVMLSSNLNSLLLVASERSLFSMFTSDLWSVKHSICVCAPFM